MDVLDLLIKRLTEGLSTSGRMRLEIKALKKAHDELKDETANAAYIAREGAHYHPMDCRAVTQAVWDIAQTNYMMRVNRYRADDDVVDQLIADEGQPTPAQVMHECITEAEKVVDVFQNRALVTMERHLKAIDQRVTKLVEAYEREHGPLQADEPEA